ncbi:MAG: fumarate hydratase [Clostridia bacterium]|nr:fumarate hydratase [Clostridia bacterium]MBQ8637351.1 fumarate hydratase [Clostridia bacterium]
MREVKSEIITDLVAKMCIEANCIIAPEIKNAIENAQKTEESEVGKTVLLNLLENARIAKEKMMPICQDTGMAVFFVELGKDVHIVGKNITDAINDGVKKGYTEGYLRKSVVKDPLNRENTNDNTPAVIYTEQTDGDKIKITYAPKGFGSENKSALKMLNPSDGEQGVIDFVIETVRKAGANPCPPMVVGVGIGGTMDKAAYLAKKALTREITTENENKFYADMEKELLEKINMLGIGPQGMGGTTTAIGVNIEVFPTHIAGLPVAVNINCHATRHSVAVI